MRRIDKREKEIADAINLSVLTINTHRRNILHKLNHLMVKHL
ncbi:MAG: hypothetical protein RI983_1406 [Bacteroidota bacterium]|jgi:DNA-binding CsgD family transcriptional regulator